MRTAHGSNSRDLLFFVPAIRETLRRHVPRVCDRDRNVCFVNRESLLGNRCRKSLVDRVGCCAGDCTRYYAGVGSLPFAERSNAHSICRDVCLSRFHSGFATRPDPNPSVSASRCIREHTNPRNKHCLCWDSVRSPVKIRITVDAISLLHRTRTES